jgi:hypothetical protein
MMNTKRNLKRTGWLTITAAVLFFAGAGSGLLVRPDNVQAQSRRYNYQLVPVRSDNVAEELGKQLRDGWEPLSVTMYPSNPTPEGLLLMRK